jgi:hypothetical protein
MEGVDKVYNSNTYIVVCELWKLMFVMVTSVNQKSVSLEVQEARATFRFPATPPAPSFSIFSYLTSSFPLLLLLFFTHAM